MMPSSYREPDQRDGDQIVYFDYAKSLENRRRPIPWKDIGRAALISALISGATGLFAGPPSVYRGLFFGIPGLFVALGLIPIIRSRRALSGDNLVKVKRRRE